MVFAGYSNSPPVPRLVLCRLRVYYKRIAVLGSNRSDYIHYWNNNHFHKFETHLGQHPEYYKIKNLILYFFL